MEADDDDSGSVPPEPGYVNVAVDLDDEEDTSGRLAPPRSISTTQRVPSKGIIHSTSDSGDHSRPKVSKTVSIQDDEDKPNVDFFLADDDEVIDPGHIGAHIGERHQLFCELEELHQSKDGHMEWKETARWIKFEEDVEEGGEKWSKPHVASLSLHALFELKKGLNDGIVLLDLDVANIVQLVDALLRRWQSEGELSHHSGNLQKVGELLLSRHRHQHENKLHMPHPSFAKKNEATRSTPNLVKMVSIQTQTDNEDDDVEQGNLDRVDTAQSGLSYMAELEQVDQTAHHKMKPNIGFMRHIPKGAQAANILVGTAEFLEKPIVAIVRLQEARSLADITEVDIPTKFVFIILGPSHGEGDKQYHEIGRCMSTLLSDEDFREVAFAAKDKTQLLEGIDNFMDQVIVLPPSEWDPSIRIEPPDKIPKKKSLSRMGSRLSVTDLNQQNGKAMEVNGSVPSFHDSLDGHEEEGHGGHGEDPALTRTGRLFGGLVNDIKRKAPHYLSDYRDALHIQCVASVVYIYIAALTPIVTFGGLLGTATDNYMGAMEGILCGSFVGVTFALMAGQPLNLIGATGPMLVFETILYDVCDTFDLEYLSFRFWIGMWNALFLLVIVAFDLSALVKYITRFTEESFAALISVIFIYESIEKVLEIEHDYKLNKHPEDRSYDWCECIIKNVTEVTTMAPDPNSTVTPAMVTAPENYSALDWNSMSRFEFREACLEREPHWELEGHGCYYVPDVFLFSVLTFLGTFVFANLLRMFKTSPFGPSKMRVLVSDFAVVTSVVVMSLIDWGVGLETPKLIVPETFQPTRHEDRGWLVNPFKGNPWWTILVGAGPAALATVLIFMDQQITAVIVNRKENKLVKGVGYHLDLFVLAIQIAVCSLLGLPWFVASTVIAVNHVISLRKESETSAPGEKAQFFGVRENRLTALVVGMLLGISVYLTVVFKYIPMAVLYGVFMYMGVSSLNGLQVIDRILLMFMPAKYQPDYTYLRHVKTYRVHIFTLIQLIFFGGLWAVKGIHSISIAFPLMVLAICFVRKGLECIFSRREIAELDDTLPESHKREKEDKKKKKDKKHRGSVIDLEALKVDQPRPQPHPQMKREMSRVKLEGGVVQIPLKGGKFMTVEADKVVYRPEYELTPANSEHDLRKRSVAKAQEAATAAEPAPAATDEEPMKVVVTKM